MLERGYVLESDIDAVFENGGLKYDSLNFNSGVLVWNYHYSEDGQNWVIVRVVETTYDEAVQSIKREIRKLLEFKLFLFENGALS